MGGVSYISGLIQGNEAGANYGNGRVMITVIYTIPPSEGGDIYQRIDAREGGGR